MVKKIFFNYCYCTKQLAHFQQFAFFKAANGQTVILHENNERNGEKKTVFQLLSNGEQVFVFFKNGSQLFQIKDLLKMFRMIVNKKRAVPRRSPWDTYIYGKHEQ